MKVIITGSLAFDLIMDFPGKFGDHILPEKIHQLNLSFLVQTLNKQRGGTAGNIAYNLALLGLKPSILATAGHDFAEYKKELEKVGVDTAMIRSVETEPTASAFIFTDQADNQIIGFYPGAMKEAIKLSIPRAPYSYFVVISPNDPSAMIKYVKECQEMGVAYLFDPGMQLPRLSDEDLSLGIEGAKIVIGNDYEISLIQKRLDTSGVAGKPALGGRAMTLPRWREQRQIWITTLGERGSKISLHSLNSPNALHLPEIVIRRKTLFISPAKPKKVLDPTGAGDAFRAGFLAGFLGGLPLETCGKMGNVAAVYTVEKYGTQTHRFTLDEFKKRYRENFGESLK